MTGIIREISYGFTSGTFTVKATCTNQDFAARVDHVTTVILTDLARTIDGINEQAAANTFGMHTTSNTVTVESGDVIRLKADGKPVIMGVQLPIDVERLVRENTDFGGPLSGLPTGITVSGVDATPDGIQITLTGRNVHLAG